MVKFAVFDMILYPKTFATMGWKSTCLSVYITLRTRSFIASLVLLCELLLMIEIGIMSVSSFLLQCAGLLKTVGAMLVNSTS